MKADKFPIWLAVSWVIYTFIRIIEYSTGQIGNPEWVIDFIPIVLPFIFLVFDNIFIGGTYTN